MKNILHETMKQSALLLIRSQRVGQVRNIQLSDLRDSDGRFYRAAKAAVDSIHDYGPWHLRRIQRGFRWIANKRLATGHGSTDFDHWIGVFWVDFYDFEDDVVTAAYLATYLVGQSVIERFQSRRLVTETTRLEVMRRSDRIAAEFARNFNKRREHLGDTLSNALLEIADSEREAARCDSTNQLQFALQKLFEKPNRVGGRH